MVCMNCGSWNKDDAQYCSNCGSALNTGNTTKPAHKMNIVGLLASLVLVASAFLPIYSVNVFGMKVNTTLIDGTDWIIVVLLGVLGAWYSLKENGTPQIVCGVLGLAYFLYLVFTIRNRLSSSVDSELAAAIARSMIERGLGYFALLFGSIGLILSGIISKKNAA